jgi:hypothetical protein
VEDEYIAKKPKYAFAGGVPVSEKRVHDVVTEALPDEDERYTPYLSYQSKAVVIVKAELPLR